MDPLTGGLLAGSAATSIIGGLANYFANASANDRAKALQDQGLQQWLKVNIPNPEDQKLALKQFVTTGTFSPQLEQAIRQDPSAFQSIATSSAQKGAQDKALSQLEQIGDEGGLRLQDKATLQEIEQRQNQKNSSNRAGINADLARQGLGGSGFDVAAQLQGQQSSADQAGSDSLKVAADAQDRALQAIEQGGNLATQYRNQDFNEQAQKASAADRINQFNTQNAQDVQQRNAAASNAGQLYNLGQAQKTSDQNTALTNYQDQYNKGLLQQQFDNQAKVAAGSTGQYNQEANTEVQGGQNTGNAISNIAGGVAGAGTAAANASFWDNYFAKKKLNGNYSDNGSDPQYSAIS